MVRGALEDFIDHLPSRSACGQRFSISREGCNEYAACLTKGENSMLYELRVYHSLPGRLPALLKRFETATVRLFEKHGIRQLGFWTVAIGESNQDLVYILQWESLAERDQKFAAFQR